MTSDNQQIYQYANSVMLAPDGTYWMGMIMNLGHFDPTAGTLSVFAGYDFQWAETVGPRTQAVLGSFNSFVVRADGVIFGKDNRIVRIDTDGTVGARRRFAERA